MGLELIWISCRSRRASFGRRLDSMVAEVALDFSQGMSGNWCYLSPEPSASASSPRFVRRTSEMTAFAR